jgi:hypothetical protein
MLTRCPDAIPLSENTHCPHLPAMNSPLDPAPTASALCRSSLPRLSLQFGNAADFPLVQVHRHAVTFRQKSSNNASCVGCIQSLSAARACLQLLDIAVTSPQSLDMTPQARVDCNVVDNSSTTPHHTFFAADVAVHNKGGGGGGGCFSGVVLVTVLLKDGSKKCVCMRLLKPGDMIQGTSITGLNVCNFSCVLIMMQVAGAFLRNKCTCMNCMQSIIRNKSSEPLSRRRQSTVRGTNCC